MEWLLLVLATGIARRETAETERKRVVTNGPDAA